MADDSFKTYLQVGYDILNSVVDSSTRKMLLQIGDVLKSRVDSRNVEHWQHSGFASRPSKPEPGKQAAQCIIMRNGDYDIAIATQDLRGLELYKNLGYGEAAVYAGGELGKSQGRTVWKGDGSISHITTHDNTTDGQNVYLRTAPDGLSFVSPWGTMKFDKNGFHVVTASGASFKMGGIGGLPAPLDMISSYATISAGTINNHATVIANGAGPGTPLASTPAIVAALQALQSEVQALASEIAAVNLAIGLAGPTTQGIADPNMSTRLAAAASAASAALDAAGKLMPTSTTSS